MSVLPSGRHRWINFQYLLICRACRMPCLALEDSNLTGIWVTGGGFSTYALIFRPDGQGSARLDHRDERPYIQMALHRRFDNTGLRPWPSEQMELNDARRNRVSIRRVSSQSQSFGGNPPKTTNFPAVSNLILQRRLSTGFRRPIYQATRNTICSQLQIFRGCSNDDAKSDVFQPTRRYWKLIHRCLPEGSNTPAAQRPPLFTFHFSLFISPIRSIRRNFPSMRSPIPALR